jgi:hypothetical protein
MANFAIYPAPFIPQALHVADGGQGRVPRLFPNLMGNPLNAYEEYVIAVDTHDILD